MSVLINVRPCNAARREGVLVCAVLVVATILPGPAPAKGQLFSLGNTEIRPFVVGLIPVVGSRGAVGGVSVNTEGVVARTDTETLGRLRDARLRALERVGDDLASISRIRKVSLRGLVAAIEQRRREGRPVTDVLQNLAGLQRVQFVLVYPEHKDIVLAGFAEGWQVDTQGNVVGRSTGKPVLQLDDLIVALRTAKNAGSEEGITCSIDPLEEGTQRLQQVLATRGLQMNKATANRLEEALGPQRVTLTGVPPGSRFAHVLVAADVMLKRLGMNLEEAPMPGMPSYLEMLPANTSTTPQPAMPRFWLAPKYDALLKSADGLAWELRGSGVQAMAEDGYLSGSGTAVVARGKKNSPAHRWAETMTAKYDDLSAVYPVFRELRNCMDLAVVAALFLKEDLPGIAGCDFSLLLDETQIKTSQSNAPKSIDSQASMLRKGRQWVVAVSGGVAVDSWSVLNHVEASGELATTRKTAARIDEQRWWWD